MQRLIWVFVSVVLFLSAPALAQSSQKPAQKEWTFLIFLNGNNNLDDYGAEDINEMEEVGSNGSINVVVQWASMASDQTKRVYVEKDNKPNQVTSKAVETHNDIDMGDWHNLVEFVRWGAEKYPAKHYFVDVWNHGGGWHLKNLMRLNRSKQPISITPQDISWDDKTGNSITTEQLGQAMKEIATGLGHKIDIYGSDACLMNMVEVAGEMADSVQIMVGSEETEPGDGWPYAEFLQRWVSKPTASAAEVGTFLTEEYLKSYSGGSSGSEDVTLSALDLSQSDQLYAAVKALKNEILSLPQAEKSLVMTAIESSLYFYESDYVDLGDFATQLSSIQSSIQSSTIASLKAAVSKYVVSNQSSGQYSQASGVSIWAPSSRWTYQSHESRYRGLMFNQATGWVDALGSLF